MKTRIIAVAIAAVLAVVGAIALVVAVRSADQAAVAGAQLQSVLVVTAEIPAGTEAGMQAIREKSVRQTAQLVALADARGYKLSAPRDAERRGGTIAFDVPHGAEVAQALLARDVVIDYRPGAGIRVAPHFYTTDDEVTRVVEEIDDILRTEAWRAFEGNKPRVT